MLPYNQAVRIERCCDEQYLNWWTHGTGCYKVHCERDRRAGCILVQMPPVDDVEHEWFEAARLVSDWRASHSGPLNTFQMNLRRRVGNRGVVAQRLKRMPSIISKLERLPRISLSQMQDIGGCRVVVEGPDHAFDLAADLAGSRIRHGLVRYKNYITHPRPSGYRGIHLVYSYNSERSSQWQGLKIEVQVRSELQHQWATAVETVGAFMRDDLKSGIGNENWLHFFRLNECRHSGAGEDARSSQHFNRPGHTCRDDQGLRQDSRSL